MVDITVVIPAYQAASTLRMSLASLAGQEDPAHEVILVDDCSTDTTEQVGTEWSRILPLRIIRHRRNHGQAGALRTGVEAAASPIIARLDADDVWLPDHLSTLTKLYEQRGGLVSANAWNWIPGEALARRSWYEKQALPRPGGELVALARRNWILGSVIFHRSDHDRVGGLRNMPACEDWDLWLRMLDAGIPVSTAPNVTMLYRQRLATTSKGKKSLLASAALLSDFSVTCHDPQARKVAAHTALEMARRARLHHSYELARTGALADARATASRALLGSPATAARAIAVTLAPAASVRLYDRLQASAKRLVAA